MGSFLSEGFKFQNALHVEPVPKETAKLNLVSRISTNAKNGFGGSCVSWANA